MYFIGIDLGSQGLKAMVVDENGAIRGEDYAVYPISYPRPAWAEQDTRHWLHALENAVAAAMSRSGAPPSEVAAIGFSSQLDGLVAVDGKGTPLRPAIIWMDRRANEQCERIASLIPPDEIFSLTGLNVDSTHVLPKIMWLRDNEPEIFSMTKKLLLPGSFMLNAVTGEYAVDYSNASSTMLLDVRTRGWSEKMLGAVGLDSDLLVPVMSATRVAGAVSAAFARKTGLRPGIPVVAGSGDEHASAIGAGVTGPGLVCDIIGTAEPVGAVSPELVFDETRLVETHVNAEDGTWFIENPGFVSGGNYRWVRDNFGGLEMLKAAEAGVSAYELLNEQAAEAPPGSEGVLFFPFMMGAMAPEWNPHARGMWAGLTLGHTRKHIIRSVLEGSAYALRDIIDRLRACGLHPGEIRMVGGGARSALMEKIRADATGLPVSRTAVAENSAYGAAMLAAVGAGRFGCTAEAAAEFIEIASVCEPDESNKAVYDEAYHGYRLIYSRLKDDFKTLWK